MTQYNIAWKICPGRRKEEKEEHAAPIKTKLICFKIITKEMFSTIIVLLVVEEEKKNK